MPTLDLAAKRAERAATAFDHAVEAGADTEFVLTIGDTELARLGKELPLTALAPLRAIDAELSLLFGNALRLSSSDQGESLGFILDLLSAYPDLPAKALRIVDQVGRNLIGDGPRPPAPEPTTTVDAAGETHVIRAPEPEPDGWDLFLEFDPSLQDALALLGALTSWYGVSLGEASGSSDSPPTDGTTSTTTSEPTSELTLPTHYDSGATPALSGSAV